VALLVLAVYVLTLSDINAIVLGTGLTSEPGEGAVSFAFYTIFAIVYAILGWMFTFGGMLGIYTPLVPYTIFTFGAIGWFIAVIEAMIAAPFVALGILSPGGQSELLGKADAGLMILFNTFLRPSLMIMGMMAAMLFSPVVVTLINSTFLAVMGSITPNPGIMELMLFMSAYASLVLTALNKSFALIHLVPDRVMSWIGHHHAGVGGSDGSDATGAMKGATDSMGGGANAAAAGSTKGAGSAAAGSAKKQQSEDAAADNAGIMAGTEGASIGGTKAKRDAEKAKKGK
jgi:defect-in-organelle-trafficking protein DotA